MDLGKSRVAVCVTRLQQDVPQLLVQREDTRPGASVALLETTVLAGEHPAEAAWRLLKDTLDRDSCHAFRKIAQVSTETGPCHVFQTALEDEVTGLEDGPFVWLPQSEVGPRLSQTWHPALQRLA